METLNIVILSISGLLLFVVAGVLRISNPIKNYQKNSGIKIENEVNTLSEVRGMSALMMFGGLIVLLGTIIPELTITSFVVAILIFLGYAIGRLLSIVLDGKPNKLIIQGLVSELVLGTANVVCLVIALV
jgi:Domain of unknown function (DUF4345)